MKRVLLFILILLLLGCTGKYCISAGVEKYGVTGEICYSPEQSEIEGNIVWVDSEGKKIVGLDENNIKNIITIIESGKKLWDFGKDFFNISTVESPSQRLNRILQEYKKHIKEK